MKKSFLHKTLLALGVFGIAMAGSHLVLAQTIQRVTDEYLSTTLELRPKNPIFALPSGNWDVTNMHLVGSGLFESLTASGESDLENLLVGDPNLVQSADTAVMLSGAMRIESLGNPIGQSGLCVNDFGVLKRCDGATIDPTPPPTFVCGETLTDERTGDTYGTMQLGGNCWMTEDLGQLSTASPALTAEIILRHGAADVPSSLPESAAACTNVMPSGESLVTINIPNLGSTETGGFSNHNIPAWEIHCQFDSQEKVISYAYGYGSQQLPNTGNESPGNYYLPTMVDNGVCPAGWRVPTDKEWRLAESDMGMTQDLNRIDDGFSNEEEFYGGYTYTLTDPASRMVPTSSSSLQQMNLHSLSQRTAYLTREWTKQLGSVGSDTAIVYRDIYTPASGAVRFYRASQNSNEAVGPIAQKDNKKFFANLLTKATKKAEALPPGLVKGKVRCIQGEENITAGPASFPVDCPVTTGTRSCLINGNSVHPEHCTNRGINLVANRVCSQSQDGRR